ncbi:transposase [Methylocystis sp. MJC1]|nr:transposase [Methylocystis sp. MJC1]
MAAAPREPPAGNWIEQQARFDLFRRVYNEERPHEALGQKPPALPHRALPPRGSGSLGMARTMRCAGSDRRARSSGAARPCSSARR